MRAVDVWDVMLLVIFVGGWYDIVITFVCLEMLNGKRGMTFKEFNVLMNKLLDTPGNYKYIAYWFLFGLKLVIGIPLYLLIRHISPMFGLIFCLFYLIHVFVVVANTTELGLQVKSAMVQKPKNVDWLGHSGAHENEWANRNNFRKHFLDDDDDKAQDGAHENEWTTSNNFGKYFNARPYAYKRR